MSQTWTSNSFQADHAYDTDMANIEANLTTLKSSFSGASGPASPVPGQNWFDTAQNLPRFRNDGDSAWPAYLTGTADQKLWLYRNDSDDGWAIDSSVTDRVLALKGGSEAYNVNGGNTAGSWTLSGITFNHWHRWYDYHSTSDHGSYDGIANAIDIDNSRDFTTTNKFGIVLANALSRLGRDFYTDNAQDGGGLTQDVAHDGDDRMAAAVGTLQYPDI